MSSVKEVFLVATGSYEDRTIVAAYLDKALAEQAARVVDGVVETEKLYKHPPVKWTEHRMTLAYATGAVSRRSYEQYAFPEDPDYVEPHEIDVEVDEGGEGLTVSGWNEEEVTRVFGDRFPRSYAAWKKEEEEKERKARARRAFLREEGLED